MTRSYVRRDVALVAEGEAHGVTFDDAVACGWGLADYGAHGEGG